MYAIVLHGGAGRHQADEAPQLLESMRAATERAIRLLVAGASALDAVVAAVMALEDNPLFNAGTGGSLNIDGHLEMDAAVMVGADLRCGAVAALQRVRNPVQVARAVMEQTNHVLLAGEGAQRFARAAGFDDYDPVTDDARIAYSKALRQLGNVNSSRFTGLRKMLDAYPQLRPGTVGAAALDSSSGLAAATSTGGMSLKMAGRVGDTPIAGAGNYATTFGAASATGHGEIMLRCLATKTLCDLMEAGQSAQQSIDAGMARIVADFGKDAGLIAVDKNGGIGVGHATDGMPHAYYREGGELVTGVRF
ncbi:MAG: isoaspartyl peptidase/L-asparaginase [Burkholderiales bacterium]|nr:isoaspartyl peptidase/L-asparaginase [Burkholderiales bacterium]